jgi:hypothetical protein
MRYCEGWEKSTGWSLEEKPPSHSQRREGSDPMLSAGSPPRDLSLVSSTKTVRHRRLLEGGQMKKTRFHAFGPLNVMFWTFCGWHCFAAAQFSLAPSYSTGTNPCSVAVADLNSDSKLDLVAANSGSNTTSAQKNWQTGCLRAQEGVQGSNWWRWQWESCFCPSSRRRQPANSEPFWYGHLIKK